MLRREQYSMTLANGESKWLDGGNESEAIAEAIQFLVDDGYSANQIVMDEWRAISTTTSDDLLVELRFWANESDAASSNPKSVVIAFIQTISCC